MIHIIYTFRGNVYQAEKNWSFKHAEDVLTRMGCEYWEIGI
jgi:hypothetical protein